MLSPETDALQIKVRTKSVGRDMCIKTLAYRWEPRMAHRHSITVYDVMRVDEQQLKELKTGALLGALRTAKESEICPDSTLLRN